MNMGLVIKFVGLVLLVVVVGIVALAILGRPIPQPLVILGSSALTGLVGLLARPNENGNG